MNILEMMDDLQNTHGRYSPSAGSYYAKLLELAKLEDTTAFVDSLIVVMKLYYFRVVINKLENTEQDAHRVLKEKFSDDWTDKASYSFDIDINHRRIKALLYYATLPTYEDFYIGLTDLLCAYVFYMISSQKSNDNEEAYAFLMTNEPVPKAMTHSIGFKIKTFIRW